MLPSITFEAKISTINVIVNAARVLISPARRCDFRETIWKQNTVTPPLTTYGQTAFKTILITTRAITYQFLRDTTQIASDKRNASKRKMPPKKGMFSNQGNALCIRFTHFRITITCLDSQQTYSQVTRCFLEESEETLTF